ncbi:MAG: hypothetical protein M5R38_11365 [Candidatus Methylomirabilis sp.]|nr:hypothetical protein [Candidatus Methylomirabilis sp.]
MGIRSKILRESARPSFDSKRDCALRWPGWKSLRRVEEIARRQLGLTTPKSGQVVTLE